MKIKKFKRGWLGGKTKIYVTSPYGVYRRLKFYKGKARRHNGIDIGVPVNTPIYSPVNGSITKGFQKDGAGLYVAIDADGFRFYFMHLVKVTKTGSVKEGEVFAYTGGAKNNANSGRSTGPHLHFEVRKLPDKGGVSSINPVYWITDELIGKVKQNTIVSMHETVPLITEEEDEEKKIVETDISDGEITTDSERDITDEIDESATEYEVVQEYDVKEGLASGIWQIVKLLIDGNVSNLRLFDVATSVQAGQLSSFFNKVCQPPLVEFFGDTLFDQYYFIVRKPPFNRDGMIDTLVMQGIYERSGDKAATPVEFNDKKNPYDISYKDIISSNISFNNANIYSWYQFYPIYSLGAPEDLQYVIPAVLFPEYASIYGSRECSVRSQYRNFVDYSINDDVNDGKKSENGDKEVRDSIHDLQYIIECNAYNPFIRQGTIQLTGNYNIKRGFFIRIEWPYFNEIFYVDAVSNSYSINAGSVSRTTTLTLSHGMVEQYLNTNDWKKASQNQNSDDKVRSTEENISYFNIIDFGDYKDKKDHITMDDWRDIISSWKVNHDVFKFFMRKMQIIPSTFEAVGLADRNKNKKYEY